MDLHEIANSGSYGSGKKVRDRLAAKVERRKCIPQRHDMNELLAETSLDSMVASLGYDPEADKDFYLNSSGYALIRDDSTSGQDARAIAALWNAYREGDLVWKDDPSADPNAGER